MRFTALFLIFAMGLSACAETSLGTRYAPPLNKPPMAWTEQDDARYAEMLRVDPRAGFNAFCNNYRQGSAGGEPLSQADYADYEQLFRAWGMSSRDIELIQRRNQTYGTGQTWLGLRCSLGFTPKVNKSFYQGLGHRWQAVLGEYSEFVYLEGDGTATGMKVNAWN